MARTSIPLDSVARQHLLLTRSGFLFLRRAILPIILLMPLTSEAQEGAGDPPVEFDRLHAEHQTREGVQIKVSNPYGDIRIRPAPDETFIVHAVVQKIGKSPLIPVMETDVADSNWSFAFTYPEGQEPERTQDGRIDVALILPEGVALEVHVERGRLLAKKPLSNHIRVRSDASDIDLKTSGSVDLYSRIGDVSVHYSPGEIPRGSIKTSNGDINIFSHSVAGLAYEVLTTGSVATNDSALLGSRTKEGRNEVFQIGESQARFSIISDTGHIRLINH